MRKGPLGRTRWKYTYNIKIDLRKMRYGGMDWTDLDEDRDQRCGHVNKVKIFRFP
jgi:hypothetical protein